MDKIVYVYKGTILKTREDGKMSPKDGHNKLV